jgi:hypothetical protein
MKRDAIDQQLESSVTRRRVIGTGVKLAYAAPVVAASFKLNSDAALAASPLCIAGTCTAPVICSTDRTCACRTIGGEARCLQNEFCAAVDRCDADSDCPGGFCFPAADNCCGETGEGRCVFPCGVHPAGTFAFGAADSGASVLGI